MDNIQDTPVQQENSGQQATVPQSGAEDWEGRYKGSVKKIEQLVLSNRQLESQLAAKVSELEQLRAQLAGKDVETQMSAAEYKRQLEAALNDKATATSELADLRQMKAKLDIVKELNAPQLVPILSSIPFVEDHEVMLNTAKEFLSWGESQVQQRERQLMAGVTPASPPLATPTKAMPSNNKDWETYINGLPLGPEREKAYKDWWAWGANQNSR